MAPRLGVEESDIQFLSRVDFFARIYYENRMAVTRNGVIALTDSDMRLVTRHKKHLFSKDLTSYPFADMRGVSQIASQIHIVFREDTIVLEFDTVSDGHINSDQAEAVFQLLAQAGVPAYRVPEFVDIRRYTLRRRTESYQRRSQFNQSNLGDSFYNQDPSRQWR